MGELRFAGISTGIDTETLITQLMEAERRTLYTYQARQEKYEARDSAITTLEDKLSSLRTASSALSDDQDVRAYSTASNDEDILTASSTSSAYEGNHSVEINRLAASEKWVHNTGIEYLEDYVGQGTFIYSYNNEETSVTTTATTTLEELVDHINNDANNPGVTAGLLYFNEQYHLTLNGNDAGSDYSISINASNTEKWQSDTELTQGSDNATLSTKITELDQFSGTFAGDERIHITGNTNDGTAVDLYVNVNSNTKLFHVVEEINDAFGGTATAKLENGKIVLADNTSGTSSMTLSLSYDAGTGSTTLSLPTISQETEGGTTAASLANFTAADFLQTQSAQDSEIRVDGYPQSQSGISEIQTLTKTSVATAGTYRLTYEGQTTADIAYDADTATIQAALEALSGVTAGDITVAGTALNASGDMTFEFKDNAGDVNNITIDVSNLTPNTTSNYSLTETTKGNNYGWIRRSSNTIDDVILGVTLNLHDTGTVDVTLTRDIDSIKEKISTFASAYNSVIAYLDANTGYDNVNKEAGILMGNYVVSTIQNNVREPVYAQTNGFIEDIDTFLNPGQIGIELDRDGYLNFDTTAFDEAIAEDYLGTLALIGADKTGSTTSNTIEYYDASSTYTNAGNYNVQVTVAGGVITNAQIKMADESTYRNMTIDGNILTGISTFDDDGNPDYSENGLQLSVDTSQDGAFTTTVRIKQGFTGAIEDAIDNILKSSTGALAINKDNNNDMIEYMKEKIELEEYRLTRRESRLIAQYARLEKNLTLIQNQMSMLTTTSSD